MDVLKRPSLHSLPRASLRLPGALCFLQPPADSSMGQSSPLLKRINLHECLVDPGLR